MCMSNCGEVGQFEKNKKVALVFLLSSCLLSLTTLNLYCCDNVSLISVVRECCAECVNVA